MGCAGLWRWRAGGDERRLGDRWVAALVRVGGGAFCPARGLINASSGSATPRIPRKAFGLRSVRVFTTHGARRCAPPTCLRIDHASGGAVKLHGGADRHEVMTKAVTYLISARTPIVAVAEGSSFAVIVNCSSMVGDLARAASTVTVMVSCAFGAIFLLL